MQLFGRQEGTSGCAPSLAVVPLPTATGATGSAGFWSNRLSSTLFASFFNPQTAGLCRRFPRRQNLLSRDSGPRCHGARRRRRCRLRCCCSRCCRCRDICRQRWHRLRGCCGCSGAGGGCCAAADLRRRCCACALRVLPVLHHLHSGHHDPGSKLSLAHTSQIDGRCAQQYT